MFSLVDDKLIYIHNCVACVGYPSEDLDEPCEMCGYTQREVNELKQKAEDFTKAYKLYKEVGLLEK